MKPIVWLLGICMLAAAASGAEPVRALILTGQSDYPYHDWRSTTPFLEQVLKNTGRFEVRVNEEPAGMTARTLANYDVLVLNYNGPRWGAEAEKAVEDFLKSGKGMIAVHGINYGTFLGMEYGKRWTNSTKPDAAWAAYAEIIGSTWDPDKIGHAARHEFEVKLVDRDHPITRGMDPVFLANDELYHRMSHRPNIHVLATAFDDPAVGGTGQDEPIIWTVPYGQGRVVHMTLGHDTGAMYEPGFLTTFARGAEWAATGAVTLPPRVTLRASAQNSVRVLVATGGHGYPTSFYSLFEGHDDLAWSHAASPQEAFRPGMEERFDALVLYDMYEDIGEAQRKSLRAFVDAGKGVVSLHHAIVDYTEWPWWYEQVIGAKYFVQARGEHPASSNRDNVEIVARPARGMANHPVLRGVGFLHLWEETYRGMWFSPDIQVLMETDHPGNDRPVVFLGPGKNTRAVYIQFGHGVYTHDHPGYRQLVHNAILWAARRR